MVFFLSTKTNPLTFRGLFFLKKKNKKQNTAANSPIYYRSISTTVTKSAKAPTVRFLAEQAAQFNITTILKRPNITMKPTPHR
jgi:hypothetical protein